MAMARAPREPAIATNSSGLALPSEYRRVSMKIDYIFRHRDDIICRYSAKSIHAPSTKLATGARFTAIALKLATGATFRAAAL